MLIAIAIKYTDKKIKNLLNEANHTADIKAKIAMNVH